MHPAGLFAYLLGPPFGLELHQEVCNTASVGSACSMSLSWAQGLTARDNMKFCWVRCLCLSDQAPLGHRLAHRRAV
jgi:hypothetical protein